MTNFLQTLGVSNQYTPQQFDILKDWCLSNIGEQYHFNGTHAQQYAQYQDLVNNCGNHPIHLAILNAPDTSAWMIDNPEVQHIPLKKNHQYHIHIIAIQGSLELMKKCCLHSDIEMPDDYLKTPLILAAEHQHPDIVQYLLQQGANPAHKDFSGKTYLDYLNRPRASPH